MSVANYPERCLTDVAEYLLSLLLLLLLLLLLQGVANDCDLDTLLPRHWVAPVDEQLD